MLKKQITFISLYLLSSTILYAYTPSIESLLRNGNNTDIGSNTVVADFIVTSKSGFEVVKNSAKPKPWVETPANQLTEESIEELAIDKVFINKLATRFLIYNENETTPKLLQADYKGGEVSASLLAGYKTYMYSDLNMMIPEKEKIEARFFYALMSSLINNNSTQLMTVIKEVEPEIKSNTNIINLKQVSLIENYKKYLLEQREAKKNKKSKEATEKIQELMENPLRPLDKEERVVVRDIMKSPFLEPSSDVQRVREGLNFYWEINKENLFAKFDSNHYLKELKLTTPLGVVEVICGKFVLFGSGLVFPEYIIFKNLAGASFEVKMKKLRKFTDTPENFSKRLDRYSKHVKTNNFSELISKPSFLL